MQYVVTEYGVGRVERDEIALLETQFRHLGDVIEATGSLRVLGACAERGRVPVATTSLVRPLGRPGAVWGVGLNYHSKAQQTGRGVPTEPILYLAAPSGVLSPTDEVRLPAGVEEPDYEGEIAVVVGRRLFECAPAEVWPAIAGVTTANDMTARDVMRTTGLPVLAKSFPGFTPLGPSVGEVHDFAAPDAIGIRTWLNGVAVQQDSSAGMIFPVEELISRLSRYVSLEPGDVVLTGTPAGTGQDRREFLKDGDEVRIEVDGLLPLVTRFRGAVEASPAVPELVQESV